MSRRFVRHPQLATARPRKKIDGLSRRFIPDSQYIGIFVPGDVRVALETAAQESETTLSHVARLALREWTDKRAGKEEMEQSP